MKKLGDTKPPKKTKEELLLELQNVHNKNKYDEIRKPLSVVNQELAAEVAQLRKLTESLQSTNHSLRLQLERYATSRLVRLATKISDFFVK